MFYEAKEEHRAVEELVLHRPEEDRSGQRRILCPGEGGNVASMGFSVGMTRVIHEVKQRWGEVQRARFVARLYYW